MTKEELINFWETSSDEDFKTMENLFNSKDYHWALFISHLVLEKLLKAVYIKNVNDTPPFIHNLSLLAEKSKLILTDEQKDFLDLVTTFNIKARYPDYKKKFYNKCTKAFTTKNIEKIKEFRLWIKKQLKNKSTK